MSLPLIGIGILIIISLMIFSSSRKKKKRALERVKLREIIKEKTWKI